jgi:hypothetical protein
MLLELLLMPRADDIDDSTDIDSSYGWDAETVPSVTWVKEEDFGQ